MTSLTPLSPLTSPDTDRARAARPWRFRPFEPARAVLESWALLATWPLLAAHAAADDHPVLVIPGLGGGNIWTTALRGNLGSAAFNVHGIAPNSQHGTPGMVIRNFAHRIDELADQHDQQVSVVAWSVGGAYARQAALSRADRVRRLITLGAPLDGPWYVGPTRRAQRLLPFPTTAIYSRTDGVYHWRRCVQAEGPRAENVQVFSSHFGMANNPLAIRVVADRLGRPPE
jgi:pimeloyl-ACP methyl ester carboxylesterase